MVRKITKKEYWIENKHYGHKTSWGSPAPACDCCEVNLCEEEIEIFDTKDCSICDKGICGECYDVVDGLQVCADCVINKRLNELEEIKKEIEGIK